ncbi:PRC-barrel domain-containing protein [Saccharopolyspora sp. HNM0983]|uniref:PRC-barrel domain-containing protein n=1 Tax=Saccharopolyspora montiporae TaxID=2781240 RepID=A0A929BB40_9PSEU|nr:PRC-barrel domain-containing protein [Saccharopolyspora sp. HNM0983]MBE9374771.1 PRC-barrel domain-containing protein [Saccharopolyspora sp. HNM0983]
MIGQREALRMFGCEVFDPDGQRIGMVGQLFLDEASEQPAWITVQTGLFGTNESFVPLEGAAFDGDTLTVAVGKDAVRLAPRVDLEQGDLLLEQEKALYLYYGMAYGLAPDGAESMDEVAEIEPEYVEQVRLRLRRWIPARAE